jgi:cytochrome c
MKSILIVAAAAGSLVAAGAAMAQDAAKLAQDKGCMNCHAMDTKKVGPSFKDISAKFKGKDTAPVVAALASGKGHPKVGASEAEIKTLVGYATSQ